MRSNILIVLLILTFACLAVAVTAEPQGIAVPVIMYHSILKDTNRSGRYIVTPETVSEDIKLLHKLGYTTVFTKDIYDYIKNKTNLPEKPVIITLDDGYFNNYTYLLPILEENNAKAVISVVGSYTEELSGTNPNFDYLSCEAISEMIATGFVEIANHSYDLHEYKNNRHGAKIKKGEAIDSYTAVFSNDCIKTNTLLAENCGYFTYIYTYPFGAYCAESEKVVKELGFLASFSCEEGINYISDNPDSLYLLKRFNRPSGLSSYDFFQNCGLI